MKSRALLNTEKRNSRSLSIDLMSTIDVLKTINEEDSIKPLNIQLTPSKMVAESFILEQEQVEDWVF